jgi:hypothetical protein
MLEICSAKKFIKVLEEGGHTKPWLLEALVKDSPVPVVMKLYSEEQINRYTIRSPYCLFCLYAAKYP